MAFTEFYCDPSSGANINAGDNAATVTTTTNGAYSQGGGAGGTDLFTAASGTPFSTAVAGDFVSVYADGATTTTFTGRITAVNGGGASIDISLTAISGTRPTTAGTGWSATIGGKWKGPTGAVAFPFNHIVGTLTNASGDYPRVNMVAGTYTISAAMSRSLSGPCRFQGYTTTPGDGGKAIIDGTGIGASVSMLSVSGTNNDFVDIIIANNGTSGNSNGWVISGLENTLTRCVAHDIRGHGFTTTQATILESCEAYLCNTSNTAATGGINNTATGTVWRWCISHDNAGSNSHGFATTAAVIAIGCISDTNGGVGLVNSATSSGYFFQCDFYNNTSDGVALTGASAAAFVFENCNFIKNGTGGTGYGINSSGSSARNGAITNCGFGSGSQANATGTVTGTGGMLESGTITYAADTTPWNAPATGDFRVTLATAIAAGYGTFTETQSSYTGTVAYPIVGAAQPSAANTGTTVTGSSPRIQQNLPTIKVCTI